MSANRLNCPPPPVASRSRRATLPPATALQLGATAKLLVEAANPAAAQALFGTIQQQAGGAAATLIQLSPGLFFARAHPCGRYWTFELSPLSRCE